MHKIKTSLLRFAVIALFGFGSTAAHAQMTPLVGGLYAGGALAFADIDGVSGDSGTGTHLYAGLDLLSIPAIARFGLEAGYLRTHSTAVAGSIDNFSASAMATLVVLPLIDLHGRVGYEDGDTSGAFQAVGATLRPFPMLGIRGEYSRNNGFDAWTIGLRVRIP